jgi:hypothetical protein
MKRSQKGQLAIRNSEHNGILMMSEIFLAVSLHILKEKM